jgi:hypothetical protein
MSQRVLRISCKLKAQMISFTGQEDRRLSMFSPVNLLSLAYLVYLVRRH